MRVTTDVLSTIQFETSKADVLIRLSILDHEKEVTSRTGRGYTLIPVFLFLANTGKSLCHTDNFCFCLNSLVFDTGFGGSLHKTHNGTLLFLQSYRHVGNIFHNVKNITKERKKSNT